MKHWPLIPNLFIAGVQNFRFNSELISFLKEYPVSGLALFNSPFDSPDNIWKDREASLEIVYEFLRKSKEHQTFISVDQEGGRVRRFRGAFIALPSAAKMTEAIAEQKLNFYQVEELFKLTAKQLFLAGVNLNFAPVCDLKTLDSNPGIIGDRSFGSEVSQVSQWVQTFCRAFEGEGVRTTLKHFPGHGPTRFDSHEQIALVFKNEKQLMAEDFKVFAECAPYASAIMTAHIAFEDEPERIVSMEAELLNRFRKKILSPVAWITDDLASMKAVSERKPWIKAFEAEYDYILICGNLESSVNAIEETIRSSQNSIVTYSQEEALEKRALHSKNRFLDKPSPLLSFSQWKAQILELESLANLILEQFVELK